MGLGRRPHSPALPNPGKMALARGAKPVKRNWLSAPPLLARHVDLGNASHRGSEAGTLVLVVQSHVRPLAPRGKRQPRVRVLAELQIQLRLHQEDCRRLGILRSARAGHRLRSGARSAAADFSRGGSEPGAAVGNQFRVGRRRHALHRSPHRQVHSWLPLQFLAVRKRSRVLVKPLTIWKAEKLLALLFHKRRNVRALNSPPLLCILAVEIFPGLTWSRQYLTSLKQCFHRAEMRWR